MATVTKSTIINDFIATVLNASKLDPAGAIFADGVGGAINNAPTTNLRVWQNGGVISTGLRFTINTIPLAPKQYSLPNVQDLGDSIIVASTISNVLRNYARQTTRIRPIRSGLYYTIYSNGQYTNTSVPSDNPNAHASGVITGTFLDSSTQAHLNNQYLLDISTSVSNQPQSGQVISASNLNSFYNNLNTAVNNLQNSGGRIDLRICHSSCHNNCHSSRGRR